jgi:hypothetical protein
MGFLGAYGRCRSRDGPLGLIPNWLLQGPETAVTRCRPQFVYNTSPMTNRIACVLAIIICATVAGDVMLYDADHLVFLAKKLAELIEWLKFWR